MISSHLPRWPDRGAAGPGATFPLTVKCEAPIDVAADKPVMTRRWWPIIAMTLFAAANAAIWCVGLASIIRHAMDSGAPFP